MSRFVRRQRGGSWVLITGGLLAPIMFAALVVLGSYLRPGYNQVSQYLSDLGSGSDATATIQRINFFLTGVLTLAFVLGLDRTQRHNTYFKAGILLLGIFGTTTLGVGVFSCDHGCPVPGTSLSQLAHNLLTAIGFVSVSLAPILIARGFGNTTMSKLFTRYSEATTAASWILLIVFLFGAVPPGPLSPWLGVIQRLFLAVPWLWIGVTAIILLRKPFLGPLVDRRRPNFVCGEPLPLSRSRDA